VPPNDANPLAAQTLATLREAVTLHQRGQLEPARRLYEAVLKVQPKNADALHLLGVVSAQSGNHQRAAELIGRAIAVNPGNASFYYNRGTALQVLRRFEEAIKNFDKALALKPDTIEAYTNRGNALQELKRFSEALISYDKALALRADNAEAHNNRGNALLALGRFEEANTSYERALSINPRYAEAFHNRGLALESLERFDAALLSYDSALALKPDYAEAHYNRGNALRASQRFEEAVASYDKALSLQPEHAAAHADKADALRQLERFHEALMSLDNALILQPDSAEAHNARGLALQELGRFDEAIADFDRALKLKRDFAEAYYNRGNALQDVKRFDEALKSYKGALALAPDSSETHNSMGLALQRLKQFDDAIASYDKAVAVNPGNAKAHSNRGFALQELKRFDEAVASYDEALSRDPDNAEAYNNRGVALQALKQFEAAFASYDRALLLKPDNAETYSNKGNAFQDLKRFEDALACYDAALALQPNDARLHSNRGVALQRLKRLNEALASYDRALALTPESAEANYGRGNALQELNRLDEALASYDKALSLQPDFLFGTYLHTKMQVCDWEVFSENMTNLRARISACQKVTPPFAAITLLDEPDLLLVAAKVWSETKYPSPNTPRQFRKRGTGERIRVGYYSADFHNHATTQLMAELLEQHDSGRFELFGFSFGPHADDAMRQRVSAAFDHFHDVKDLGDAELAELSLSLGIDIAVDLKGFTGDSRPGVFAERCAPIQVNYLGFPGTMGASFIDYIIADKTLIPAESQQGYSEKIVRLPNSYQPNDTQRKISDRAFTREELGLPDAGFVFCCFNNNYKIFPETFDTWMRILKAVDDSVLWLLEDNATAAANLRKEAEARGVDNRRLIFAERMPLEEHLARQKLADLFLDNLPCNAHTTASDALWAGLPVLTCKGKAFAGRVAASLLNAIDLPELVTGTQEEYERRAIELATDPALSGALKSKLALNRTTKPLFNSALYAKHIEAAYEAMMARYEAGLAPDVIEIEPLG
jgi:predicted O-linked N-acetylglucosamine transferase (SPINDLY family)